MYIYLAKETNEYIGPVEFPQADTDDLRVGGGLGRDSPPHVHRTQLEPPGGEQRLHAWPVEARQSLPLLLHPVEGGRDEDSHHVGVLQLHLGVSHHSAWRKQSPMVTPRRLLS